MSVLSVHHLTVARDGVPVLDIPALEVHSGEILALIGPNGAGKSTLLLTLALLLHPTSGEVRFHGQPVTRSGALAARRRMALVLQDPLLLHGAVASNIAAGLRFRALPKAEIRQRVDAWAERLGIAHLKNRPARRLSGGEAQRTSLARALAIQPDVLLLDEPFSALDAPTRAALLEDLRALLRQTGVTTVFVTHDLDEALLLGDRVAVLIGGSLRQVGAPEDVFSAPTDPEVARFVGVETVIPALVRARADGVVTLDAAGETLEAVGDLPPGAPVYLCLRPEEITLSTQPAGQTSARNALSAVITAIAPQGAVQRIVMAAGSLRLVALVTRASAREMALAEGQPVHASFKATAAHLIPR